MYVSEYGGLDHSVYATAAEHEAALSTLPSVGGTSRIRPTRIAERGNHGGGASVVEEWTMACCVYDT